MYIFLFVCKCVHVCVYVGANVYMCRNQRKRTWILLLYSITFVARKKMTWISGKQSIKDWGSNMGEPIYQSKTILDKKTVNSRLQMRDWEWECFEQSVSYLKGQYLTRCYAGSHGQTRQLLSVSGSIPFMWATALPVTMTLLLSVLVFIWYAFKLSICWKGLTVLC